MTPARTELLHLRLPVRERRRRARSALLYRLLHLLPRGRFHLQLSSVLLRDYADSSLLGVRLELAVP